MAAARVTAWIGAFLWVSLCCAQSPLNVDSTGSNVYYVGADQTVHRMSLSGSTWSDSNLTTLSNSGVQAEIGIPPQFDANGNVFYIGADQTVHELSLSGSTWSDSNLSALSKSGVLAEVGVSPGIATDGGIFYTATDNTIHKMTLSSGQWADANATGSVASCQSTCSPPVSGASLAVCGISAYYVGTDTTIHELIYFWGWIDESEGKSANPNVQVEAGTSPATFTSGYGGAYFVATDQTIHQLSLPNGAWVDTNLMAASQSGARVEAGTWPSDDASGNHVYFVATDQSVHEMSWNGSAWVDSTLTLPVMPEAGSVPVADGNGNLYLVAADRTVHQESLSGGQWVDTDLTAAAQSSALAGGTISGTVTNGSGLPGVTVALSGTKTFSTVTDSQGHYSFYAPAGGSYTVAPTLAGYIFSPSSQTFNSIATSQTANFSAAWNISGAVTQNGSALSGVAVSLSGSSTASTTTDSNGHYLFKVASGGSYTVTPSLTGYLFTPASQTLNNITAGQTANFTAAPASGGTLDPKQPAKDYIHLDGQVIAVENGQ